MSHTGNPKALFCQSCSARAHNQTSKCEKEPRSSNRRLYFLSHPMVPSKPLKNQSIEFEVVRLDRFCCPIAMTIAVQNLCAVLLSHLFWPLHAIFNYNLNIAHSTRFLLVLSNSQVSPKFKESMLRYPFTLKAQIRWVMS